jgi:DNA-binding NarL/FixJ family response regulator
VVSKPAPKADVEIVKLCSRVRGITQRGPMNQTICHTSEILLVEDNPGDVRLIGFSGAVRPETIGKLPQELKADPELRDIPVVVLTTSRAEHDIVTANDLRARGCIQKPIDLNRSWDRVRSIESFWLGTAALPRELEPQKDS